jgi:hypothetical protein
MSECKRAATRITAGYKAEITFEGKTYHGIVENLSETGVNITIVIQEKEPIFPPGKKLKITFVVQTDETVTFDCLIRWAAKLPPQGLNNGIGLEILDPNWEQWNSFL